MLIAQWDDSLCLITTIHDFSCNANGDIAIVAFVPFHHDKIQHAVSYLSE